MCVGMQAKKVSEMDTFLVKASFKRSPHVAIGTRMMSPHTGKILTNDMLVKNIGIKDGEFLVVMVTKVWHVAVGVDFWG